MFTRPPEIMPTPSPPTTTTGESIIDSLPRVTLSPEDIDIEIVMQQAQALAAYLGWLGIGPLQDVLLLPESEAKAILKSLQSSGVLSSDQSHTPRFVRLSENPLGKAGV